MTGMEPIPGFEHSEDYIAEQAYLVARGVRPLALVGSFRADPWTMTRVQTTLGRLSCAGAIPFVVDRGDGVADAGYAAAGWAVDLFSCAVREEQDAIPTRHRDRVLGLLLGYSPTSIRDFEEQKGGRLFAELMSG
jgi:hypothetical protein